MRCVVTAGPTYEPLDRVRRLTNFSTGRLGSELVNFLAARGHEVILLIGQLATWRGERHATRVDTFTTTADLSHRLHALSAVQVDVVFHAAAVSDFSFGKVWQRSPSGQLAELKSDKLSSRNGALLAELVPTQKIIAQLRSWYPEARLIGWKYEVDGDRATTVAAARAQLVECRTDACVANGPAYGDGFGLIPKVGELEQCADMVALFRALEAFVGAKSKRPL